MQFIITDPCIETKDTACVDVCPVDCIHPRKDEAEFAHATMLYIHPEECIDCGACVPACPVTAIYDSIDSTPANQKDLIEANAIYRNGDADAVAKAEAIVKAHIAAQPALDSPSRESGPGLPRRNAPHDAIVAGRRPPTTVRSPHRAAVRSGRRAWQRTPVVWTCTHTCHSLPSTTFSRG